MPSLGTVWRSKLDWSRSDNELESIRRRLAANLMVGLSVGFHADRPIWERPPARGMPPGKRVRGAEIVEAFVGELPGLSVGGALSLDQRSAREEESHQQSQELIERWPIAKPRRH
jgi:hypothetical protein